MGSSAPSTIVGGELVMNVQRVVVGVLLSLIGWTSVMAAEDVKGSRDHPLIKRYEGAVIVKYARRISMNIRCRLEKRMGMAN